MKKTAQEPKVTENSLYHDTWMLLRKYRDVVWSLELSVQQVRRQFQIEYGSSIEEFLESLYVAGITFEGSAIEDHARCIERSYKMLKLLDTSVELLRTKHKYGESYYWLLYYTYLSPQQLANTQEIIDKLEPHIRDISYRTYFRKRQMAIDALSSVLWGIRRKRVWHCWRSLCRRGEVDTLYHISRLRYRFGKSCGRLKQNSCHRVDFDDYGKPDLSPKIKGERKNPKYPTDYIH